MRVRSPRRTQPGTKRGQRSDIADPSATASAATNPSFPAAPSTNCGGPQPSIYTIEELATRWRMHPGSIRRLIRLGHITSFRIGKRLLIYETEVTNIERKNVIKRRPRISQRSV
jgi:excisionase family DNA binding protein